MWDIAGDFMDLPALEEQHAKGDSVGIYQGSEPFEGSEALDGDGLSLTTWPWIAWRYKLDTLYLYNGSSWSYRQVKGKTNKNIWENPINKPWKTNSQGVIMYPGDYVGLKEIVPSIRMKQIRRGMQDYEYFWLLAQKGQAQSAKADEICKRIMPRSLYEAAGGQPGKREWHYGKGAWQRDPRQWSAARAELAQQILAK
jgi:hypothetical protein